MENSTGKTLSKRFGLRQFLGLKRLKEKLGLGKKVFGRRMKVKRTKHPLHRSHFGNFSPVRPFATPGLKTKAVKA